MLIIAETDLHLIIAISYIKKIKTNNYYIIWIGNKNSYSYKYFYKEFRILFLSLEDVNFFNVEKIDNWLHKNLNIKNRISSLATFYDTDFLFEYLRSKLKIEWNNIYLIDDGIASLYKVSMPKLYRRLPKAIYNFFLLRFNVNLSYYSLGSNTKISNFITIFPDFINYSNRKSNIIDVFNEYSKTLNELSKQYFDKNEFEAFQGCVISLSPVLKYRRQSVDYVYKYLRQLINHCDIKKPIYFKPHPRDDDEELIKIIEKLKIPYNIIDSSIPLEFFFNKINDSLFIGMPSTAFCIRSILKPNSNDEIIIIQEKNDPFPGRISVLKKIFKKNNTKYKIL